MQARFVLMAAIGCAAFVTGCGGASESTTLGTASNPRVRAINLIPSSSTYTVNYDNFQPPIGTAAALQQPTAYSTENEGNHTVSFISSGSTVASYNGLFQLNNFYTVAVTQQNGNYQTFLFSDNSAPTGGGVNQLRIANTIPGSPSVDVYVTPGSSANPTLTNGNLLKAGLAYGSATNYDTLSPGQFTVTITTANSPSSVLFNQVVSLSAAQAETAYAVSSTQFVSVFDNQGD
jgi:hypothetical protein